jgi:hypothetical protein
VVLQDAWDIKTVSQDEIGPQIQNLLASHIQTKNNSPSPVLLLLHNYTTIKEHLVTLGVTTTHWTVDIAELLGFQHRRHPQIKREEYLPTPRKRSCSPRGSGSRLVAVKRETSPDILPPKAGVGVKREASPDTLQPNGCVYIMDTVEMFKTVTDSGVHPSHIRPVTVHNVISGRDEHDTWCAGDDSR